MEELLTLAEDLFVQVLGRRRARTAQQGGAQGRRQIERGTFPAGREGATADMATAPGGPGGTTLAAGSAGELQTGEVDRDEIEPVIEVDDALRSFFLRVRKSMLPAAAEPGNSASTIR